MQLTSATLQFSAIAAAVLITVATLLLWNRVPGPHTLRWAARVGLLVGGYAATALAVLLTVNILYGGLIVSVSDLFSDPHAKPMHHSHGPHDPWRQPGADQPTDPGANPAAGQVPGQAAGQVGGQPTGPAAGTATGRP